MCQYFFKKVGGGDQTLCNWGCILIGSNGDPQPIRMLWYVLRVWTGGCTRKVHWRIVGGGDGVAPEMRTPFSVQFLSKNAVFWQRSCQIIGFCPKPSGWYLLTPFWEILDCIDFSMWRCVWGAWGSFHQSDICTLDFKRGRMGARGA